MQHIHILKQDEILNVVAKLKQGRIFAETIASMEMLKLSFILPFDFYIFPLVELTSSIWNIFKPLAIGSV